MAGGGTTIIFPMAGEGARFGYRFKPFLEIDGEPFIAAAVAPFRAEAAAIDGYAFIYLERQEQAHDVSARLGAMFADLPFATAILPEPTPGPAVTLREGLRRIAVDGPIIVCDCDHALDVAPIFAAAAADPAAACILPTWSLDGERVESWGVAGIEADGRVVAIAEKRLPDAGARHRGVIGCYWFADAARVAAIIDDAGGGLTYISDIIARMIADDERVIAVDIDRARFFGDPERLASAQAGDASSASNSAA